MTANGTNALATSLLIICRRLEDKTRVITEGQFIEELKNILPKAIKNLKTTNIAPADLPQCSIGPGIGVFTKYKKILQSDDTSMSVKKLYN